MTIHLTTGWRRFLTVDWWRWVARFWWHTGWPKSPVGVGTMEVSDELAKKIAPEYLVPSKEERAMKNETPGASLIIVANALAAPIVWLGMALSSPLWLPRWLWVRWKRRGKAPGYPSDGPMPPVHAQCRSTFSQVVADAMDDTSKAMAGVGGAAKDVAASMKATVDERVSDACPACHGEGGDKVGTMCERCGLIQVSADVEPFMADDMRPTPCAQAECHGGERIDFDGPSPVMTDVEAAAMGYDHEAAAKGYGGDDDCDYPASEVTHKPFMAPVELSEGIPPIDPALASATVVTFKEDSHGPVMPAPARPDPPVVDDTCDGKMLTAPGITLEEAAATLRGLVGPGVDREDIVAQLTLLNARMKVAVEDMQDEDAARKALAEIEANPDTVVSGEALKAMMDEWEEEGVEVEVETGDDE